MPSKQIKPNSDCQHDGTPSNCKSTTQPQDLGSLAELRSGAGRFARGRRLSPSFDSRLPHETQGSVEAVSTNLLQQESGRETRHMSALNGCLVLTLVLVHCRGHASAAKAAKVRLELGRCSLQYCLMQCQAAAASNIKLMLGQLLCAAQLYNGANDKMSGLDWAGAAGWAQLPWSVASLGTDAT